MGSLLDLFRSNAEKFRARLKAIRDELERKRRRREELRTLRLPPPDVLALFSELLDARAAAYEENFLRRFDFFVRDPSRSVNNPGTRGAALVADGAAGGVSSGTLDFMLAYFFKDQILAKISEVAERTCTNAGPSRADRAVELKKLDAEISELEREEKDMLDELDAIRQETTT